DLQRVVRRYLYILVQQLGQMAVCNAFHDVSERLARWLLMTHDRAHSNHFHLTHEFMAKMLGVRRSAVSIAASALQAQELISYTRGQIRVQSRQGLEAAACECYRVGVDAYSSLFSRPNKTSTTPTP
ncbi:MAG: helix-turn-helix domain-containing protein, partial [Natronospirillum sp.]